MKEPIVVAKEARDAAEDRLTVLKKSLETSIRKMHITTQSAQEAHLALTVCRQKKNDALKHLHQLEQSLIADSNSLGLAKSALKAADKAFLDAQELINFTQAAAEHAVSDYQVINDAYEKAEAAYEQAEQHYQSIYAAKQVPYTLLTDLAQGTTRDSMQLAGRGAVANLKPEVDPDQEALADFADRPALTLVPDVTIAERLERAVDSELALTQEVPDYDSLPEEEPPINELLSESGDVESLSDGEHSELLEVEQAVLGELRQVSHIDIAVPSQAHVPLEHHPSYLMASDDQEQVPSSLFDQESIQQVRPRIPSFAQYSRRRQAESDQVSSPKPFQTSLEKTAPVDQDTWDQGQSTSATSGQKSAIGWVLLGSFVVLATITVYEFVKQIKLSSKNALQKD